MVSTRRYLACFCVGNLFILTYFLLFDSISDALTNYFAYFQQWPDNAMNTFLVAKKPQTTTSCKIPKFSPWDPSLLPYIQHPKEVTCHRVQPDLTYLNDDGALCFNDTEISTTLKKSIYCEYAYFDRGRRDRDLVFETAKKFDVSSKKCLRLAKPFLQISCYSNTSKLSLLYANVYGHPILNDVSRFPIRTPKDPEDQLNVLIFTLESTSLAMVHRHLPLTKKYLTTNMTALEFTQFLKVGENTMPNLIPIFTGLRARNEDQNEMLAEILKDKQGFYDHYPMIWKNFSKLGYFTSYIEDYSHIGTFHYSGNGFRQKPVDSWYFPFWEALRKVKLPKKSSQFCFGNRPMVDIFADAVRRHVTTMTSKNRYHFTFAIFSDLSHDYTSDLERADRELYEFFRRLYEGGDYLNRTLLFFMGDHGPRYTHIRPTPAGFVEERNPALFVRLPSWFYAKYPRLYANLKINTNRLISPFDLYETLLDVLTRNFSRVDRSTVESRGRSLFLPIPAERTCRQAGVPRYYCLCEGLKILNTSNKLIYKMAEILVDSINNMTAKKRQLCARYYFQSINYALEVPDQKFHNQSSSTLAILISVNVLPYAKFEGLLAVDFEHETIIPHPNRFERINRFFGRGNCMDSIQESKFCTCKSLIPKDEQQMLNKLNFDV